MLIWVLLDDGITNLARTIFDWISGLLDLKCFAVFYRHDKNLPFHTHPFEKTWNDIIQNGNKMTFFLIFLFNFDI